MQARQQSFSSVGLLAGMAGSSRRRQATSRTRSASSSRAASFADQDRLEHPTFGSSVPGTDRQRGNVVRFAPRQSEQLPKSNEKKLPFGLMCSTTFTIP